LLGVVSFPVCADARSTPALPPQALATAFLEYMDQARAHTHML
jgi:hypothetical protein